MNLLYNLLVGTLDLATTALDAFARVVVYFKVPVDWFLQWFVSIISQGINLSFLLVVVYNLPKIGRLISTLVRYIEKRTAQLEVFTAAKQV